MAQFNRPKNDNFFNANFFMEYVIIEKKSKERNKEKLTLKTKRLDFKVRKSEVVKNKNNAQQKLFHFCILRLNAHLKTINNETVRKKS